LRAILEPLLELLLLDPPDDDAFGLTGTPNELTVREADRLEEK